jgi:predicted 3-demethylubiquinone-9 3-methyltransferase (glyoxalase superfamily)
VPVAFMHMMTDPDQTKVQRAMQAMFGMKKLDIAELERAFAGQS